MLIVCVSLQNIYTVRPPCQEGLCEYLVNRAQVCPTKRLSEMSFPQGAPAGLCFRAVCDSSEVTAMLTKKDIELRFSEFQPRHTGKDPFGPLADITNLYQSLSPTEQGVFQQVLASKREDRLWRDFIGLFEKER